MTARLRFGLNEIGRVKFVIYEPDTAVRSILRGILLTMGAQDIMTAATVERMRDMPRDSVDIVILRLTADQNGEGLIRTIRKGDIAIRFEVAVIAYAAQPTIGVIRSALIAGADEVLALPFTGRSVSAKVLAALGNPKPLVERGSYRGPDHREAVQALLSYRPIRSSAFSAS